MTDPIWLENARVHEGLAEVPGPLSNTVITGWLSKLNAWWREDATPWCGVFVAAMIEDHAALPKHWYRAKAWLDWGVAIDAPAVGCVVVFERQGGGHVGFVVGKDSRGRLLVLGGNQGDRVSVAPFEMARVAGYRWPAEQLALLSTGSLPVLASAGASSTNEA
jgi:uncharacterized protein (TIGR02594 family)